MGKAYTKWECIMNQDLEKVLNQIVNLLVSIEKRLSQIENNTENE